MFTHDSSVSTSSQQNNWQNTHYLRFFNSIFNREILFEMTICNLIIALNTQQSNISNCKKERNTLSNRLAKNRESKTDRYFGINPKFRCKRHHYLHASNTWTDIVSPWAASFYYDDYQRDYSLSVGVIRKIVFLWLAHPDSEE